MHSFVPDMLGINGAFHGVVSARKKLKRELILQNQGDGHILSRSQYQEG